MKFMYEDTPQSFGVLLLRFLVGTLVVVGFALLIGWVLSNAFTPEPPIGY